MKKIFSILLAVIITVLSASSCNVSLQGSVCFQNGGEKIIVTATIFPQYDFARAVGGKYAKVNMLLPPGTESHTFDPKPSDIAMVADSDLFIYTGEYMEPWAGSIVKSADSDMLRVIDASSGISLIKEEHDHETDEHHDEEHEYDPHIWLDMTNSIKMVETILDAFCNLDPAHTDYYTENAEAYIKELKQLDSDFLSAVENGKRKTIVFGGRFAYGYFIERYGLSYESAYDSCSSEAEPSIKKITEIIDFISENDIPVIYHEELVNPKVASVIASDTGIQTLELSTGHSVSRKQLEEGVTFIDVMKTNLENIKRGLN